MRGRLRFLLLCAVFACSAVHAQDKVVLATIFPRSGTLGTSLYPVQFSEAVRLAVDEINERGGLLGRKVEIIEFDSQSTALGARAAAMAALKAEPLAVIGERISSLSLVVAPIMQNAGVPMITPISTHPQVTRVGDYIFRMCYTDAFQGKVMAQFARNRLKAQTAVVLVNVSQKYSEELARSFVAHFKASGGNVSLVGEYLQDSSDFTALLTKVKPLKPDVLFIPGYAKDAGALMRHARALGLATPFLGGDGWGNEIDAYAGPAVAGSYRAVHWHRDDPAPLSRDFIKRFERRMGPIHSDLEALAYDAVQTLADAVRRANSLDRGRVRDALAATSKLPLVTGLLSFDAERNAQKPIVILRHEAGRTVFVESITPEDP